MINAQSNFSLIEDQLQEIPLSILPQYGLIDGANYFGSSPSNTIIFPGRNVAPHAGIFFLANDSVLMRVASSIVITRNGKSVDNIVIYSPGVSQVLQYGEIKFRIVKEQGRYGVSFMTVEGR